MENPLAYERLTVSPENSCGATCLEVQDVIVAKTSSEIYRKRYISLLLKIFIEMQR